MLTIGRAAAATCHRPTAETEAVRRVAGRATVSAAASDNVVCLDACSIAPFEYASAPQNVRQAGSDVSVLARLDAGHHVRPGQLSLEAIVHTGTVSSCHIHLSQACN